MTETPAELLTSAVELLPGDAAVGGATVPFVTGAIGIGQHDLALDMLVELGLDTPVPAPYWLFLRQAAWLLPDVDAVAYHRRHGLPKPGDDA
ncbi:hypothetical protein [Streptacidiphilus albus]|uniref:hypothetical protein n=1 Tax=Streptacidiphilus albus TaxID=105425 RepID=UPI00054BDFB1|nr:hypothetical protein [Streptacidiphilus albus]